MRLIILDAAPITADPIQPFESIITNFGFGGLLILLLLLGRLVVKSSYDELRADRDAWKAAYFVERDARTDMQKHMDAFDEQGKLTNKLLDDLKTTAHRRRE